MTNTPLGASTTAEYTVSSSSATFVTVCFASEVYCYGRVVDVGYEIRGGILGAIEIIGDSSGDDLNRG